MDPKDEIIDELRRKVGYFETRCLELKSNLLDFDTAKDLNASLHNEVLLLHKLHQAARELAQ